MRIDVNIFFKKISASVIKEYLGNTPIRKTPGCDVRVSEQAMCFEYERDVTILVARGNEVIVDLKPTAKEEDIIPYLEGYVLSILLHQRNYLVLHASVMMIHGRVVAFLGGKGYGKSTLAASFEVKGHKLVSDDTLPVFFESDDILTLLGYPQIKLFADSVKAVGGDPSQLRLINANFNKYSFPSQNGLGKKTLSLSAIYVLNLDEDIYVRRLSLPEAFIAATTHTHVNCYLKESNSTKQHFEQCQKLVQTIPFFQLNRPHDFEKMYTVTEMLEQHFNQLRITEPNRA